MGFKINFENLHGVASGVGVILAEEGILREARFYLSTSDHKNGWRVNLSDHIQGKDDNVVNVFTEVRPEALPQDVILAIFHSGEPEYGWEKPGIFDGLTHQNMVSIRKPREGHPRMEKLKIQNKNKFEN